VLGLRSSKANNFLCQSHHILSWSYHSTVTEFVSFTSQHSNTNVLNSCTVLQGPAAQLPTHSSPLLTIADSTLKQSMTDWQAWYPNWSHLHVIHSGTLNCHRAESRVYTSHVCDKNAIEAPRTTDKTHTQLHKWTANATRCQNIAHRQLTTCSLWYAVQVCNAMPCSSRRADDIISLQHQSPWCYYHTHAISLTLWATFSLYYSKTTLGGLVV